MKKSLLLVSIFLSMMSLTSCSKEYVTFYNYDGTVLYKVAYSKDMTLTYEGETPTKPSDDMYTYIFKGWNHSLYDAETSKQYFAEFTKELREFTVTFRDYNNSFISSVDVKYGDSVVDFAPTNLPDRETMISDDPDYPGYTYKFAGWSGGDLTYITSNIDFIASYNKVNVYAILYMDNDGSLLDIDHVEEGGSSSCDMTLPYKEADSGHFYVFNGWSDDTSEIHSGLYVTAQYKLVKAYTVTFENYDGTVLYTVKVPEGGTAVYPGGTPYRSSTSSDDYHYTYTFTGWSGSLTNIHSNTTVTAQFSTSTTYTGDPYSSVKSHLNSYGSDSYHNVSTGEGSTFGYKGSSFYVGYKNNGSLNSIMTGSYDTSADYFLGNFEVRDGSTTTYEAYFEIIISNHLVSTIQLTNLVTCRYSTDAQLTLVAQLNSLAVQYAVNRASRYLENHNLPYIW